MKEQHLWHKAAEISPQIISDEGSGFSIGFDQEIPAETQDELRAFVAWVEENFSVPVPLWVDFEYRHYLMTRDRKRAGYLFYWDDLNSYQQDGSGSGPVIRLPVRTEHYDIEEILFSFIQAISCYYLWLTNVAPPLLPDDKDCEEILRAYKEYNST